MRSALLSPANEGEGEAAGGLLHGRGVAGAIAGASAGGSRTF